jgi:hypothetical protein
MAPAIVCAELLPRFGSSCAISWYFNNLLLEYSSSTFVNVVCCVQFLFSGSLCFRCGCTDTKDRHKIYKLIISTGILLEISAVITSHMVRMT